MKLFPKISWAVADKITFLIYGLVFRILQIQALPPDQFGLYGLFEAASIFLFIIADNLALTPLIKFGHDPVERARINFLTLVLYGATTLGFSLLFFILRYPLADLLNESRFTTVATFFPLFIVATIPRMYLLALQQRDLQMHTIFVANFLWMGTMAVVTIWLLIHDQLQRFEDMMIIAFAGSIISSTHLIWISRKNIRFSTRGRTGLRQILRFSGFVALSGILSNLLRRLDIYVVQIFFSTTTTGLYQSAKTLFRIFEALFHAISSVLFPATAKVIHQQNLAELRSVIQRTISGYFWLSLGISILSIILAPFVIPLLLPAEYNAAISLFQILATAGPFLPLSVQMVILIALGKTKSLFQITVITVMISFSALLIVGITQQSFLIPAGIVLYHGILGLLIRRYLIQQLGLSRWYFCLRSH